VKRRHRFDEIEELLARGKRFRIHPQRAHKPLDGTTDGFIVIDNGNKWLGRGQNNDLRATRRAGA
jgi:hypothetical protein